MILGLPHHKLDELLLVLQICTYRILLYIASPRRCEALPTTAQLLQRTMRTKIATMTLAY
jgi:hypothetical protein